VVKSEKLNWRNSNLRILIRIYTLTYDAIIMTLNFYDILLDLFLFFSLVKYKVKRNIITKYIYTLSN